MTKAKTTEAGYQLTVESWENDADHYITEVLNGLTKEACQYYVDLCKLMVRSDDYANRVCNIYDPSDKDRANLSKAAKALFTLHGKEIDEDDDEFLDAFHEDLCELGLGNNGDFYTRVCSSYSVVLIPENVTYQDVTNEF